jgi:N-acetylated-alpha-linked acidic dipeptidase
MFMRRPFLLAAALAAVSGLVDGTLPAAAQSAPAGAGPAGSAASTAAAPPPLAGFSAEAAARQRQLESRFDASLRADDLRAWMKQMTAYPHHVGSRWGKENANFMAGLLRSWGYEVAIEEFQVLFPTPKTRLLELEAPVRFRARLAEPALPEDATSGQTGEQLPIYNAYSIDGDVTGELVYVNHGVPRDYEELERRGIDVRGKVVLARYGGSWRGIKPKVAAEHGAIGCLIFSDPAEDGYVHGETYPRGGFRPELGAQRGSVADMPLYPGDPLTPGKPATRDAERLDIRSAPTLTKIPVLPISWADARPLLEAMGGPVAPEEWRGALPVPYRLGPGPARVHLRLEFDWQLAPAYDVIAKLPGAERPDQWILRGNHHDGWVNGATDPVSGMVALLAEAKAVGELARTGWRPQRTLVYAAWDAEEPGLLGSTEWAEAHADLLRERAVAYINSDSNSRGFLDAAGSHSLERLVNEVARDVPDPRKGVSVGERLRSALILQGSPEERQEARAGTFRIDPLGSGSDYTPFLQHLGIASLNVDFGGEGQYGQYHSIYDSFDHFTRFMDPDFAYGVALAKTNGRLMLRLSEAEVLPFDFRPMAAAVARYVDEVAKLADDQRAEAEEHNRRVADGTFQLAADPNQTWAAPAEREAVPFLNFAPLRNAAGRLERAAREYGEAADGLGTGKTLAPERRRELETVLLRAERALTRPEGLPGRPWYRHYVYAPGFYTGYGVKTLPAVREAIEQRQFKEVDARVAITAKAIEDYAAQVERAAALARSGG